MLHGRGEELVRLRNVALDARGFAGRSLVIAGDPGIGKTALLDAACAAATKSGLRVLRARGSRSEAPLPFAALSTMLWPLAGRVGELPPVQAALLGGALGFSEAAPGDPLAVAIAAFNLLGIVSGDQPILLVCDDTQWLDPASFAALLFIAGRLNEQSISVLFAVRSDDTPEELARVDTLELSGLDPQAAAALLAERFADALAPEVSAALVRETAGNPLALLELPGELSSRQRAGVDPLRTPLPAGDATRAAYRQRISSLPERTRRALVVAASADDDLATLAAALGLLGLSVDDLAAAVEAKLIWVEGAHFEFRHALVRSVAHHDASLEARREAHKALAAAQPPGDARRVWHLAEAAEGPDEETAGALEGAAIQAITRSGLSEASTAFSYAAGLSVDPLARARRQLGAAQMALYAGELPRAQTLSAAAIDEAPDAASLALARQLRGRVDIWWPTRPLAETAARIVEEAAETEVIDLELSISMLFEAAFALIAAGELKAARGPAERALALAKGVPQTGPLAEVDVLNVWLDTLTAGRTGAIEQMIEVVGRIDRRKPEAAQLSLFLDVPLMLMGRHAEFLAALAPVIDDARGAAALIPLATLLSVRADGEMQMGRWALSEMDAFEAISLSPPGSTVGIYAHATVARLASMKGDDEACRRHAHAGIEMASIGGVGSIVTLARGALALLEQTLGNHERALELHMACAADEDEKGVRNPLVTRTAVGMVEAAAQLGRGELAEPYQRQLEHAASELHAPMLHAFAAYGRGLLAAGDAYRAAFEEALGWHTKAGRLFERGRTQLAYGERLRRDRQRLEARLQLRAAIDTFAQLGATPWAERARRELLASGETTHPRTESSRELLTPQELQVARLAADGLSNNEIASRLFISPRTVEKHMTAAFRKLDVSSRRGLILAGPSLLAP